MPLLYADNYLHKGKGAIAAHSAVLYARGFS
jgi:hypothetical protein